MFSNYDLKENNFQIQTIFDIGTDQIPLSQNSRTCLEYFATQRFDLQVLGCCREIITGLRGERPRLWWLSNHCVTGVLTFSLQGLRVPTVKSTSQMSYLKSSLLFSTFLDSSRRILAQMSKFGFS